MRTSATPLARLLKLLGTKPKEIRQNFDLLVFGATQMFGWSPTLQGLSGFAAEYDPHAEFGPGQGLVDPCFMPLFRAYIDSVAASAPWTDVLGDVHAQLLAGAGGEGLGQSFTPPDLASLSGLLASRLSIRYPPRTEDGISHIHEAAVGCGSLLLGLFRQGWDPASCDIDAWDLDPLCCAMTALQIAANAHCHRVRVGRLTIREGNTLTEESRVVWFSERLGEVRGPVPPVGFERKAA